MPAIRYLNGLSALAELLVLQKQRDRARGLNTAGFVSGYRGSPLAGFDQLLTREEKRLRAHDIHFVPGLNEELAATSVWGSQQVNLFGQGKYDGVFGMWYAKAPGVERSTDALRHANFAGTSPQGGVLALLGDDHSCKSSTLPSHTEPLCRYVMMPVLSPAGVQEVLEFGLIGWEMSRACGLWVGLKCLIDTMDASACVDLDLSRLTARDDTPSVPRDGGLAIRWPDTPLDQERRLIERKLALTRAIAQQHHIDRVVSRPPAARIGIVATGKSFQDVRQALFDLGLEGSDLVALYKVGMPWPLDTASLQAFAQGLEKLIIVEEKSALIEEQARSALYELPDAVRPRIVGKQDETGTPLFPAYYELEGGHIAQQIGVRVKEFAYSEDLATRLNLIGNRLARDVGTKLAKRTAYFCAGCPHSSSTNVPGGSRALAGIGCHYMAQGMDRSTATFSQMGGEGAAWIGQAPFSKDAHVFVNLGDGTYMHSGALAIRAAIAAKVNATYKILFNGAVAMTGGQPVEGEPNIARIAAQLLADGVQEVVVVSDDVARTRQQALPRTVPVHPRAELEAVQLRLRGDAGVTAIIYDQACATERRRKRKRKLVSADNRHVRIAEEVCEGCGDCGKASNCVAIKPLVTPLGRKRAIDPFSCNQDFSCTEGFCPSFITVHGDRSRPSRKIGLDVSDLPPPAFTPLERTQSIVIAGIGGTGVVTLGAILGLAAESLGMGATVLDMIGMAQKGGQVLTHLRLAPHPEDIRSYRIPAGSAELLLGCDGMAAASPDALRLIDPVNARAVIALEQTPTGDFARDPDYKFPSAEIERALADVFLEYKLRFVDAHKVAIAALGDAIGANLVALGCAVQLGLIALPPEAIEAAIARNGVGVEQSLAAFRWGRKYAVDPDGVAAALGLGPVAAAVETLEAIVVDRIARLEHYQNAGYAARYEATIRALAEAGRNVCGGTDIARAAARNLYKVMAYKDEYEISRLLSNPVLHRSIVQEYDGMQRLQFHLAPPFLPLKKANGRPQKITVGEWIVPLFRLLAAAKGLRGTNLDPFGWAAERRHERAFRDAYFEDLALIASRLSPQNVEAALALAEVPERVRGFGYIKAAAMAHAMEARRTLRAKLEPA